MDASRRSYNHPSHLEGLRYIFKVSMHEGLSEKGGGSAIGLCPCVS